MARPYNDQTGLRKLNLVGSKTYAVSIPITIIRQLNLHKGDYLIVRRSANQIIIEPERAKTCAE
jgi:antitoxin component of MazEF toxin-antitoxin module